MTWIEILPVVFAVLIGFFTGAFYSNKFVTVQKTIKLIKRLNQLKFKNDIQEFSIWFENSQIFKCRKCKYSDMFDADKNIIICGVHCCNMNADSSCDQFETNLKNKIKWK